MTAGDMLHEFSPRKDGISTRSGTGARFPPRLRPLRRNNHPVAGEPVFADLDIAAESLQY